MQLNDMPIPHLVNVLLCSLTCDNLRNFYLRLGVSEVLTRVQNLFALKPVS